MRRVLVAQSVGLWIRLNRHFSGVGNVDLVETPTLEGGRLLAQLERPAVVVFGREAGLLEAESLVAALDQQGCHETRVVLISDDAEKGSAPRVEQERSLVVCGEAEILPVVTELLASSEKPQERLDLLVHYACDGPSGSREGFVIVLDLDEKTLVFQADEGFEPGAELSLGFFLPGAAPGAERTRVALDCRVESGGEANDLIYTARISSIDPDASRAVERFLGRGES